MVRWTPLGLPPHFSGKGCQFLYSADLHPTPTFLSIRSFIHSFILQACIEHIRVPGPVLGIQEFSHLF